MARLHTHYDNLKVARNAPPEIIRAAYKTLSQKYHPDKNPGDVEAARIMAIINTSYDVLSNPVMRQEHDLWIAQQERAQVIHPNRQLMRDQRQSRKSSSETGSIGGAISHVLRNWFVYGLIGFSIWVWNSNESSAPEPSPIAYQAEPPSAPSMPSERLIPIRNEYVRPSSAPNGKPWPSAAGYVRGYKMLNTSGLSAVTVDNGQNDSDVFVKLVSLDGAKAYPVRQFYIPAFGSFTLNEVTSGSYDVRYRDLGNGGLSRSESFNLEEIHTPDGVQYSKLTMTLYKVQNGNMQTYALSESEF